MEHALVEFETQASLYQRNVLAEEEVVGIGPVDAADLVHVAKTARGDECRARPASLQQRVDGDRRAMEEQRGLVETRRRLFKPVFNAADDLFRGGELFAERRSPGRFVEANDIRECPPHIRGDAPASPFD